MTATGEDAYTTTYSYDANNRLLKDVKTTAEGTESTLYFYDPNGNQIGRSMESQAASVGTETFSLTDEIALYELSCYNGLNQLISTRVNGSVVSYDYAPSGLRLSKTVNDTDTSFLLDRDNVVAEQHDGVLTAYYARGLNLFASFIGEDENYYLYNGHGDVVQLTDTSGTVSKTYEYDAFGNEKDPASNDLNPFRYCAEYYDVESGRYYLRARYYTPITGLFTCQDTLQYISREYPNKQLIIDPLSLNLYTYCLNNPIQYRDSSGHIPVETILDLASLGWSYMDFVRNPSIATFGFLAWDAIAAIIPYAPGSYSYKTIKAGTRILSTIDNYVPSGVWAMKAFDRGREIEKALGGWNNNFPVIDNAVMTILGRGKGTLEDIVSIKSLDLTAKTYQKASSLRSTLKGYVNTLANFKRTPYNINGIRYTVVEGTSKTLEIAIPPVEMTRAQASVFQEVTEYARSLGVTIVTRIVS